MENNRDDIARRIIELYAGSAFPEDIDGEVKKWLVGDYRTDEKAEVLWDIWNGLEPLPQSGAEKVLRKLKWQLGMDVKERFPVKKMLWISAAAIVAVLLLIPGLLRFPGQTVMQGELVADNILIAGEGEKKHAGLSETAGVWLNSSSELNHTDQEEVELDGEAFFNVQKVEGSRFAVKGGMLKATVTGTSFNYRSYASEQTTVISLYEGTLLVDTPDSTLVLSAGHELVYDKTFNTIEIKVLSRTQPVWMRDIINFEDVSVGDIFRALENTYGITISDGEGARQDDRIELKFEGGISLEEVLFFMSSITGSFEYEIENDKVIIYWITENDKQM